MQKQLKAVTTPGTRLTWSTLKEWMGAWAQIDGRAPSSKRHAQRSAHIAALASNMDFVNCENDIGTLAAVKQLIERGHLLPPRGRREGHPATEILQRVGTVLNERRRDRAARTETAQSAPEEGRDAGLPATVVQDGVLAEDLEGPTRLTDVVRTPAAGGVHDGRKPIRRRPLPCRSHALQRRPRMRAPDVYCVARRAVGAVSGSDVGTPIFSNLGGFDP